MNVSEQLLEILKAEQVKHIFGVAGDALNPLVTAIGKQDTIKWIKVKHEGNASFAAFAQGELSGNLGVCASTVGPGALHLINGLYNAKKERSPVLAITGQVPVQHLGTNYHQEANLTKIFDDVCDYQAVIRSPEEAPRIILRAIRTAINQKCVCRIELPADIAKMPAKEQEVVHQVFRSKSAIVPHSTAILNAAELINNTEKIGILAGAGCRNARAEVLAFAEKISAPITHTVRSCDVFDKNAKNVVGLTGLIGNPSGYQAVMECDLLIMLGTDFPYINFLPEHVKTIQIDLRPENIGNRKAVDVGIHGDIKSALDLLTPACKTKEITAFLTEKITRYKDWLAKNDEEADPKNDISPMHPQIIAKAISDIAADDAIFVVDTGTAAIWTSNFMDFHSNRRVIGSFNHGSMAVGLPAAIGAQLLYPEREVWAITGDGAFNMALQDFSTAVEYNLPINVVVLNNSELGFVKIEMEESGLAPNYDALGLKNIDFAGYAQLCGGEGKRLEHSQDVYAIIKMAKESISPTVIDAKVTGGALSLPPKIGIDQAANFGISKVKEVIAAIKGDERQWENIKNEVSAYFDKKF